MTPEYRIKAEERIKQYLEENGISSIKNIQVENTYDDLGVEVHVWNVKTEEEDWWVVESESLPLNLYTQGEFYFSADEAYSFHLGIIERLEKRRSNNFKHVIDEIPLDIQKIQSINRSLNEAAEKLNDQALSPEELQGIGLTCRESLIKLGKELAQQNYNLLEDHDLKASDFKGIAKAVIKKYAPGSSNKNIRKHARRVSKMAWNYSSEVTHSDSKTNPDVKICLLLTCTTVSIFENLYLKYIGFDDEEVCSNCNSRDLEIKFSNNKIKHIICNDCGTKMHDLTESALLN